MSPAPGSGFSWGTLSCETKPGSCEKWRAPRAAKPSGPSWGTPFPSEKAGFDLFTRSRSTFGVGIDVNVRRETHQTQFCGEKNRVRARNKLLYALHSWLQLFRIETDAGTSEIFLLPNLCVTDGRFGGTTQPRFPFIFFAALNFRGGGHPSGVLL